MLKMSYCQREPIKSELRVDRQALTPEQGLDLEMLMQDWAQSNINPRHVYADDGKRYQILARRLPDSDHLMVALYDKHYQKIVLTAVKSGPHQPALSSAYRYCGKTAAELPPQKGWNHG